MQTCIPELCKEKGISQRQLAFKAGITPEVITKWVKHGIDCAYLGHIKRVSDVLDVSIEDLIEQ